jgi:hypothetical protein
MMGGAGGGMATGGKDKGGKSRGKGGYLAPELEDPGAQKFDLTGAGAGSRENVRPVGGSDPSNRNYLDEEL